MSYYDDEPQEVTVEKDDPRVDMMREFSDLDRHIERREAEDEHRRKELSELRSKREHLRNKLQRAIAPSDAASDEAVDTLRRKFTGDGSVTFNDGGVVR